MIVDSSDVPSNDQHEVQLGARTINQMGPPIIYPITDAIQSSVSTTDFLENTEQASAWAASILDDKLLRIMTDISGLQNSVNTF